MIFSLLQAKPGQRQAAAPERKRLESDPRIEAEEFEKLRDNDRRRSTWVRSLTKSLSQVSGKQLDTVDRLGLEGDNR
jgi:hypothetical protein